MAKKKSFKKKGGSKGGMINTTKLLGKAGGILADKKFLTKFLTDTLKITDPKMQAVAKMAAGELLPKQDMVRNLLKNDEALTAGGDALSTLGMAELFVEMNIAGMGEEASDELAVVIEGIDDVEVDEDVLGEDVLGDDDLDVVNDDDDIDTINDDDDDSDY